VLCRSTTNLNKRIELLESSVYKSLKTDVKEKMIRQPHAGLVSHCSSPAVVLSSDGSSGDVISFSLVLSILAKRLCVCLSVCVSVRGAPVALLWQHNANPSLREVSAHC